MRGVESLSAVRVTGSVGICGALGACKKHVKSYNTAKFHSLRDALLAGADMRPVLGFHIFGASLLKFVQSTKSKETYTTVRSSFRKDTLLAGLRMRPVIGIYSFDNCKRGS